MKKMLLLILAVATFTIAPACADDIVIPTRKLPQSAQEFLNRHFAGNNIVKVVHDSEIGDNDYTVWLSNGVKVEFNGKGDWESVESKAANVPDSVIPASIREYVVANYPLLGIAKIEKSRYGYEVELTNSLEMKFDLRGNFVGLDD